MTDAITRRTTPLVWDMPSTPVDAPRRPIDNTYYASSLASLGGSRKKASEKPTDWFSAVGNWVRELFFGSEAVDGKSHIGTTQGELPNIPQLTPPSVRSRPSAFHEKALQLRRELNQNLQNLQEEDDTLKSKQDTPGGDYLRQLFACYMEHKENREEASKARFDIIQKHNGAKKALNEEMSTLIGEMHSHAKSSNLLSWVERGTALIVFGAMAYNFFAKGEIQALKPDSAINTYLLLAGAATRVMKFNLDYKSETLEGKKVVSTEHTNALEKKINFGLDYLVQMQEELARIIKNIRNHLNNHHQAVMESIRAK